MKRSGFLAFCAKLGDADSLIKSASYLLHGGGFSKVRDFLLDHSATILQDDSGIPLAYFDPKKWRLQPFGRYIGPIAIFGHAYQSRLGDLYRKGNAIPIDFGVGYRWRKNESNLLLAQRIAAKTSETELAPPLPTDRYLPSTDTRAPNRTRAAVGPPKSHRKRAESEDNGVVWLPIEGDFLVLFELPVQRRAAKRQNGDIVLTEAVRSWGGGTVLNPGRGPAPQAFRRPAAVAAAVSARAIPT